MSERMNIILVCTDTLRADHLPNYAREANFGRRIIAPNLHAFGESGVVFDNFHAASFPTVPARADITTGRYTFTYRDWGPLRPEEPALAEILHHAGYVTCGIADNPFVIRYGNGYDRGFEQYIWIRGQRQGQDRDDVVAQWKREEDRFAPQTFRAAAEWLERNHSEQPFFLYIDTWDPHEPWDPPPYYVTPYEPDYQGEDVYPCYWEWEDHGMTRRELELGHACYCGEITMVDRWFGILLERVRQLGLEDDTAIFFLSDHGFYFGERGIFGKSRFRWPDDSISVSEAMVKYRLGAYAHRTPLHREITQVPLLARIPGVASQRVAALASIPDLMPTVLELTGQAIPEAVQARSLLPLLDGRAERLHDLVVTSVGLSQAEGGTTKIVDDSQRRIVELSPSTIRTAEWDFFYAVQGERAELYRAADRANTEELSAQEPEALAEMHAKYLRWLEGLGAPEGVLAARQTL